MQSILFRAFVTNKNILPCHNVKTCNSVSFPSYTVKVSILAFLFTLNFILIICLITSRNFRVSFIFFADFLTLIRHDSSQYFEIKKGKNC